MDVFRTSFFPPSTTAGRSVRSFSVRWRAGGRGSCGETQRPAGTRKPRAEAAESEEATHSAARPQKAWPLAKTGSAPGKDKRRIPVPEASRRARTVCETEHPAGRDRDTRASQRSRPAEKATVVTSPLSAVWVYTSDTRPNARVEFSCRTERSLVFCRQITSDSFRFRHSRRNRSGKRLRVAFPDR